MRVRTKSLTALALLLPAPLLAQKAPAQADLVGTWVRSVDGQVWGSAGKIRQEYLVLRADGIYSTQAKSKAPELLGSFGEIGGVVPDSMTGEVDSAAGESAQFWGRWALGGDSVKFGRDGQYRKYKAVLQGQELSLIHARPIQVSADAKGVTWDPEHHTECTVVFRRHDPSKPLPQTDARNGCQTVARAFPWPPMPKAADLLGTWAVVQTAQLAGGWCTNALPCTVTTYDTLAFQGDSTLLHKVVQKSPVKPNGEVLQTFVPKLKWWIASDTLWREGSQRWPMTSAAVWLEDGGQYLNFDNTAYHRVTTPAP